LMGLNASAVPDAGMFTMMSFGVLCLSSFYVLRRKKTN
jgi:hypothetical protein